jgi:hypothetical protein
VSTVFDCPASGSGSEALGRSGDDFSAGSSSGVVSIGFDGWTGVAGLGAVVRGLVDGILGLKASPPRFLNMELIAAMAIQILIGSILGGWNPSPGRI